MHGRFGNRVAASWLADKQLAGTTETQGTDILYHRDPNHFLKRQFQRSTTDIDLGSNLTYSKNFTEMCVDVVAGLGDILGAVSHGNLILLATQTFADRLQYLVFSFE